MLEIIADIGSNHGGSLTRARDLVRAARDAGADAVKLGFFRGRGAWRDPGMERLWRENEVPAEWLPVLAEHCRRLEVGFLCSIFDPRHIELLDPWVERWELESAAARDPLMIAALARTGKPLMVATGLMARADLMWTVNHLRSLSVTADWLYCPAGRPCREPDLNLGRMRTLARWASESVERRESSMVKPYRPRVGLSDQTLSTLSGAAAVGMGAEVLAKHLRLLGQAGTPDSGRSLEPGLFAEYAANARSAQAMLGSGRWPLALERDQGRLVKSYVPALDRIMAEQGGSRA